MNNKFLSKLKRIKNNKTKSNNIFKNIIIEKVKTQKDLDKYELKIYSHDLVCILYKNTIYINYGDDFGLYMYFVSARCFNSYQNSEYDILINMILEIANKKMTMTKDHEKYICNNIKKLIKKEGYTIYISLYDEM